MKVVFFVSRNKDNQAIKNFVERKVSFVINDQDNFEKILREFDHFVDNGLLGEKCRLYISVNRRDDEKVRKALLHYLIDHPELDLSKIDRKIASIAGKVENKAENKWLFDIDTTDESTITAFKHDLISAIGEENLLQEYNTPNGKHIIIKHGFDSRELMTNWKHIVDLKRDEMQLLCFKEKN